MKKKTDKLKVLDINTNEVLAQLGFPSTKSTFNNEVWIYLERKITSSELKSFGRKKLLLNDVAILEFNTMGMLVKKEFLSIDKMNDLKISKNNTNVINDRNSFVSTFLTSLKQKINDPLGVKTAK